MTRNTLLLFVILLLLPVASAELVHDDWHTYHDFFTVGEDYYEVTNQFIEGSSGGLTKTYLQRNQADFILTAKVTYQNDTYFVKNEQCKRDGLLRFCIANVSLDPEEGGRSDEYGNYRLGTHIKIYEEPPDAAYLELEREYGEEEKLRVGQEQRIRMHITNKGNKTGTNIRINETVGEGLTITKFEDFDYRIGKTIKATIPQIARGEEIVLNYYVVADTYINNSDLTANISYLTPAYETLNDREDVTIPWPFTLTTNLQDGKAKTNEKERLTFTLRNDEDDELAFTFTVKTPANTIAKAISPMKDKGGNMLSYAGTLNVEEQITLTADILSSYTGEYNISTLTDIIINDQQIKREKDIILNVHNDDVTPILLPNKEKMRSGESLIIALYLKNEDDQIPFFDLQGWLGSDFFNESYSLEAIAEDRSENVIFKHYYPPKVDKPTTITLSTAGTFKTQTGQSHGFRTQKDVLILPENQSVILYQDVDKTEAQRGDLITITVRAENIADSGYRVVTVQDHYTNGLTLDFGTTEANVHLNGREDRQLYLYQLKIPYDWAGGNITITTEMAAQGQEVSTETTTVIVTDALSPGELGTAHPDEESEQEETKNETAKTNTTTPNDGSPQDLQQSGDGGQANDDFPEKEPGFFAKISNAFKKFFSDFFS